MPAILLFLINTLYIIVATYIVLKFLRFPLKVYANSKRRKFVNRAVTLIAASFAFIAVFEFVDVMDESKFQSEAKSFLSSELAGLPNGDYLSKSAIIDYNGGESQITYNTFGQKPISNEIMDLLVKKIKANEELKSTKILFVQEEIEDSYTLNNAFLKELRLRDSIDIALKKDEIENLNKEINKLRIFSEEKLLFSSIINEAKLIYPGLNSFLKSTNQFELISKKLIRFLVVSVSWSKMIDDNSKLQLNQSIQNWIALRFESKNIEIFEKN